jgi:hypothetical protein
VRLPRNAQRWLPGYLAARGARLLARPPAATTLDVMFCIADHYEPDHRGADQQSRHARVSRWVDGYPQLAEGLRDADGRPPRYSFFFPAEIYAPELVAPLAALCHDGFGEFEVHIHHSRDTSENLRNTLTRFTEALAGQHGLLSRGPDGQLAYGFIHGNWALDNSHAGGTACGVDDEITVLRETGCYADFTMPPVVYDSQSRLVNRVYFAIDDPRRPASHLTGPLARAGQGAPADGLLMIPGPLALNWRQRIAGVVPRIDSSAIDYRTPPSPERFTRWLDTGVGVAGRPEWIFIKAHTHGAPEANADVMLGGAFRRMLADALERFNDGRRFRLHFVTAREMANIALAAVDGRSGNAGHFRDYRYLPVTSPRGVARSPAGDRPEAGPGSAAVSAPTGR